MGSVHVIATLLAQPGREAELEGVLLGLVMPTRQERGCIRYELVRSRDNPREFVFVEEWEDDAALDRHFESDHIRKGRERMPELLATELIVRRCDPVVRAEA